MKQFLEKIIHTIIPHEKNGNIPHILKGEFIFILVVFVGVLFYFNQNNLNIIKSLNLTATVYPSVLADLANKDRSDSGVHTLAWNNTLENAAKLKAQDMLSNGYFAHTSPSGVTPWHWLSEAGYDFIYAGENLAVDFTESINVEKAWINSPLHKENILSSNFTEIGIATIDGIYKGKNTTFVVEFFGSPLKGKISEKSNKNNKIVINETKEIVAPTVAGASIDNLTTLEETDKFVIVKNNTESEFSPVASSLNNKSFSTCWERFVVSPTQTIRIIYTIIFGLVLLSMIFVLFKEYKKHHAKHLLLGIILIILIVVLSYLVSV